MLRLLLIIVPLLALQPFQSMAADSDRVQTARIFLDNGNPDQAIRTSEKLLQIQDLSSDERSQLLSLIADAEIIRATARHFTNIQSAIHAIQSLLSEFPDLPRAAHYRWQRAWLLWKNKDYKQAITADREIIALDQQPANLRRAWLMMARIHIHEQRFAYARSDLLQYGLQVRMGSREQAVGMVWMAIVDHGESHDNIALSSLDTVFHAWPTVITDEPLLLATYIQLLQAQKEDKKVLHLASIFIRKYINTDPAAGVRLIQADIFAKHKKSIPVAIMEYGILSNTAAGTDIGRKAFMRKLMLENRDTHDRKKLLPVMQTLQNIANTNQLSPIEDEAMLDLARLWIRIASPGNPDAGRTPALDAYAHAAISTDRRIATSARREGADWMQKKLKALLKARKWLIAVAIWRKYPQLQPAPSSALDLRISIAHAMRMLMLFNASEDVLQKLYARNKDSVLGQRIMLELAKLWMDRQDTDGVKKIMRWLNRHPFNIYRPEMMLIVARIQVHQKQPEMARQTLAAVHVDDLTMSSRASFWRTSAAVSAMLGEWHSAAREWLAYRNTPGANQAQGLLNQADALLKATEFTSAYTLYMQIPEKNRDAAWQYHVAICQMNTGELNQASQRLNELIKNKDAGHFATLARLKLADNLAAKLLGAQP